ncbi:MAG TPA: GntR family transcriptional regulator [Gemmatimonadaceae bacterium]|nr:GntR family transcriptional regulator [Gemmatimonadaceae bacterium]
MPSKKPSKRGESQRRRHPASSGNGSAEHGGPLDNVSRVHQELRSLIVLGHLPPGSRIPERAVAERLGLSRTPVRSALHRLQQEGLIASSGGGDEQRLIVTPLTQDDGQELFLLVAHLEGLAARIAAGLPPARRREIAGRLRHLNRQLAAESAKRADVTRAFDADLEFHRAYVEGVAGPRLLALHRAIKPQTERYARLYVSLLLDELPTSVREHDAITRAILKGDPRAAQHAVETNWHNAAVRLGRIIAQHGERGIWHTWTPATSA